MDNAMKSRIIHMGLASWMTLSALGARCPSDQRSPADVYTDPQLGFRIARPDCGWIVTDQTGIQEVLVTVKSKQPIENFIPNMTVSIEPLPSMMTAQEYGEKNLQSLREQRYEILSNGMISIHQNVFYDLHCAQRSVQPALRFRHLCLVKDRLGFIITCTTPQKHYQRCESDFHFIVNSFRFL